ncbi:MAG: hypothetical protein ACM3XO_13865 [Bacteroidota bacterium]
MQLINWLELQPLLADVDRLNARLREALPVRKVCQSLAEITLHGYPWSGRSDLIPCYHPAKTYKPGQWLALPIPDPHQLHPTAWQVAQVKQAETTGNSVQGRFQALTLDVAGKEIRRSAGLAGVAYQEPGLAGYTSDQLGWLVDWVADTYAGALLSTLRKLIQKGRIFGQLEGETFLPEQMFALSVERLDPFFAQLSPALRWISLEEILQGLPDLSHLKRETAMALVRSTLKVSPYRPLGCDRWTTTQYFDQMDREVPVGLCLSHSHLGRFAWTRQDKKDLAGATLESMPVEARQALDALGFEEERSEGEPSVWQPPQERVALPSLSYLHITQACFPVAHLLHAFAPDARMVFVQFREADHQPFLLDREHGLLKAVKPEVLQAQFRAAGLPAGTHLWLVYQGDEIYRIAPQPLAVPRQVPCKRASLREGKLHIEQSEIQMEYECDASVFQADIPVEALFAALRSPALSLRETLISAIQELCAADRRKVASRADIFNAVFLQRPCSPHSVAILLYSLPCFVHVEGDYFRYMQHTPAMNIWKGSNRVTQLWEDLAADIATPDPVVEAQPSPCIDWEPDQPLLSIEMLPLSEISTSSETVETEPEPPLQGSAFGGMEETRRANVTLLERVGLESVQLIRHTIDALTTPPDEDPGAGLDQEHDWDMSAPSQEKVEEAPVPAAPMQAGHAFYPTMIRVSMEPDPQPASSIDTRRIAYGLKIPSRPLHKRPFYQRIFFCVRGWFHPASG